MGPLIALFWTSGVVIVLQGQGGSPAFVLSYLCAVDSIPPISPLVHHLLTSWWPALQSSIFDPCTGKHTSIGWAQTRYRLCGTVFGLTAWGGILIWIRIVRIIHKWLKWWGIFEDEILTPVQKGLIKECHLLWMPYVCLQPINSSYNYVNNEDKLLIFLDHYFLYQLV